MVQGVSVSVISRKLAMVFQNFDKAVAVRNSLLEGFSGKLRRSLGNSSPIFWQHDMLSLTRFGTFRQGKWLLEKSAPPAGTLLDFLLRDRHSHFEFFSLFQAKVKHISPPMHQYRSRLGL